MDSEREQKIQSALAKADSAWDAKYKQEDWIPKELPRLKLPKNRRIGGRFASKAMKNLY